MRQNRGNSSSLTQSLRELEKSSLDGLKSYHRADFPTQPTNLAQDTRIARADNLDSAHYLQNLGENSAESSVDSTDSQNLRENISSLRENERSEFSWQSAD